MAVPADAMVPPPARAGWWARLGRLTLLQALVAALALAAVVGRLLFWRYTDRTWEDALITVLHVENFWQGLGLTHVKPGEPPLHGFTSPVSILVPLVGGIAGQALAFQKLVSALAAAGVVLLADRLMREVDVAPALRLPWAIAALTYVALEHHQILWGMAGMETTVVTAILFFFFFACAQRSAPLIGVAMALALYARPDFLFLNLIGLAFCLWQLPRRDTARAVGLALLLYAPWLLFTFAYYGSPVPHTIVAKFNGYAYPVVSPFDKLVDLLVPLGPSFAGHGTGYWRDWDRGVVSVLVAGLFVVGAYQAVLRRALALYVPIAFAVVYWAYYVFLVAGVFGWYLVPLTATTVLVAGYGLVCVFPQAWVASALALLYVASFLSILPANVRAERDIQRYIEAPVRKSLGLYLGEVLGPGDEVLMEPLGYSSWYSRRPILDYPGLASRRVTEYLQAKRRAGLCMVLRDLKPKYVALRWFECKDWGDLQQYELVREFKAHPKALGIKNIQHNIDVHFLLYRRKEAP